MSNYSKAFPVSMYMLMLLKWRDAFRHRKRNDLCFDIVFHFGNNADFISENRRVGTLNLIMVLQFSFRKLITSVILAFFLIMFAFLIENKF